MPQTRPRRTSGARPTDEHLLDAAREVFADQGFHAATMSDISERANSTKPTLYAHFGGKDELYASLLEREADRCRAHLFAAYEAAAGLGLRDQTRADVEALFEYVQAQPAGFELLFGHRNALTAAAARDALVDELSAHLAQRLTDFHARATGRPVTWVEQQLAAMLVGSAITAAQHAASVGGDLDRASALATSYAIAALENLPALARP